VLSLPIKLRGQVIGSVDVRAPDNRQWDQDEMDIVTAIIERAAVAMENSRLLAESRKRAVKEAKIGEISARIGASINMRNVLQAAVEELGRALPGSEVVLQFEGSDGEKTK
jgi:adenylate cyclase